MTREGLARLVGRRVGFTAVFKRYGKKPGFWRAEQTVLLASVRFNGEEVTDHVWLTVGKRLKLVEMVEGDHIGFEATVTRYEKGYRGHLEDYELEEKGP